MKRKVPLAFSFLSLLLICSTLQSQTVLQYETHGFTTNLQNDLHLTSAFDPGAAGSNVVWDFSELEINNEFSGVFEDPAFHEHGARFHQANTVVEEFGNLFYFRSDSEKTEQYGFVPKKGNIIEYEQPFVKMRYPFAYGDAFSGDFSAMLYVNDKPSSPIEGHYEVIGDATGTLILPGDIRYENALRVKEIKRSSQIISGKEYQVDHIAYRWYVNQHRFPVLSVLNHNWIYPDGNTHNYSVAGYNPVILHHPTSIAEAQHSKVSYSVYPNPYQDFVSIRLYVEDASDVQIAIFDQNGRMVKELARRNQHQGELLHTFSARNMGLQKGVYYVRFTVNGKVSTQKIVEI